jgi:chemotaxis protein CheX
MQTNASELVDHVVRSTQEVFRTMLAMEMKPERIVEGGTRISSMAVTATVGFGGSLAGLLAVCLSERMALHVTQKLLGSKIERMEAEVTDAMGEMANMIGGSILVKLSHKETLRLSLPNVVIGRDYTSFIPTREPITQVEFAGHPEGIRVALALVRNAI